MKGADIEIYLLLSTEELSSSLEAVISRLEHIFIAKSMMNTPVQMNKILNPCIEGEKINTSMCRNWFYKNQEVGFH